MRIITDAISRLSSSTLFLAYVAQANRDDRNKNDDRLEKNADISSELEIDEALLRENCEIVNLRSKYDTSRFGCGI